MYHLYIYIYISGDFDVSTDNKTRTFTISVQSQSQHDRGGFTFKYAAPELLPPKCQGATQASDVYSVGLICLEMFFPEVTLYNSPNINLMITLMILITLITLMITLAGGLELWTDGSNP